MQHCTQHYQVGDRLIVRRPLQVIMRPSDVMVTLEVGAVLVVQQGFLSTGRSGPTYLYHLRGESGTPLSVQATQYALRHRTRLQEKEKA